jgi:gliding motility-associated-like protein
MMKRNPILQTLKIRNWCIAIQLVMGVVICSPDAFGQNMWTFMNGSQTPSLFANFGVQGVAAATNTPGARYASPKWTDATGKFWLFGGSDGSFGFNSDMWRFDPVTNLWTWIGGPQISGSSGVYGTQGVPSATNWPGGRGLGSFTWEDQAGNFWLFGGYGTDAFGAVAELNDLWKYDVATGFWTWMRGSNAVGSPGSFGTLQMPSATNDPPARYESNATWVDNNGDLWLFGGLPGPTDDFWRYTIATNTWTWMAGTNSTGTLPNYGVMGVPAATNTPGARFVNAKWTDASGNFWLFGGTVDYNFNYLNDLWKFDPVTLQWTWMNGANVYQDNGIYGTLCVPATNNYPSSRYENRACWTDPCGRFWSFGGMQDPGGTITYGDMWVYDPGTNQFDWINGTNVIAAAPVYGTMGVPAPTNYPGARAGTPYWMENGNNNLWIYGGLGGGNSLSDHWRYEPDSMCPMIAGANPTANFNPSPASGCAPLNVTFLNTSAGNQTNTWDFDDGNSSGLASPTHTFNSPGTYNVSLIISGSLCGNTGSDTVVVQIVVANPSPFSLGNDTTICPGDQITLNAGAAGSHLWSTNQVSQSITVTTPGTYWVQNTFSPGCTVRDSIVISTLNPGLVSIDPVPSQCLIGNSFSFTVTGVANPFATYQWNFFPGATPSSSNVANPIGISFASSGTKFATLALSIGGCTVYDTLSFMVAPQPNASWTVASGSQCFAGNQYSFAANNLNPPGATYQWAFPNGTPSTSASVSPVVTFNAPGTQLVSLVVTLNGCADTTYQSILVNPDPVVNAGLDVAFCEGEGGAMLNGVAAGGSTPYYWVWWCDTTTTWCGLDSVYDNDPLANPNGTTMYYVQVTDFNGCVSNIDSALVTVLPKPIANAGADVSICQPQAPGALLSGSITGSAGPFAYHWMPGTGLNDSTLLNPYARPDTTTIYTLQVMDLGTGCLSDYNTVDTVSSVIVTVQPLPIAQAGPDLHLCLHDTLTVQSTGTGAGPVYDFEWSPATGLSDSTSSNPLASPPATTEYVLTVWSNGCPSYGDTVTLFVHTLPTVDAGPDVEICFQDSILLDAQAAGDPTSIFYDYQWSPAIGLSNAFTEDPMASAPATMLYYVQGISSWGCRSALDSALLTIKPSPQAEAGPAISVCAGRSVQLSGMYTYPTADTANPSQVWPTWVPGQYVSDSTVLDPWATPPQSMHYYLNVQYNTCNTVDSVLVTVIPSPGSAISADTTNACVNDTIQLTGIGGNSGAAFNWIPPTGLSDPTISNPIATPGDTVTYYLIVSEGGCSDTSSITLNPIPGPHLSFISSSTEGCVPLSVNFFQLTNEALFHTWHFGDGTISNQDNPTHQYVLPGTYQVSLEGVNTGGCLATNDDIVIVVVDTAHADFVSNPDYPAYLPLPGTEIQFDDASQGAVEWHWNFGDGISGEGHHVSHSFTEEGVYFVTLRVGNSAGCTSGITHGPYIITPPDLFIPNVFSPNGDNSNDVYLVKYTGNQPFLLNIFDRWGSLIFNEQDKNMGWDGKFDGKPVPEGVYYFVVTVGSKSYTGIVTLMR